LSKYVSGNALARQHFNKLLGVWAKFIATKPFALPIFNIASKPMSTTVPTKQAHKNVPRPMSENEFFVATDGAGAPEKMGNPLPI
jgi:hypothetical protein